MLTILLTVVVKLGSASHMAVWCVSCVDNGAHFIRLTICHNWIVLEQAEQPLERDCTPIPEAPLPFLRKHNPPGWCLSLLVAPLVCGLSSRSPTGFPTSSWRLGSLDFVA